MSEPAHPHSQASMLNKLRSSEAGEPPKVLPLPTLILNKNRKLLLRDTPCKSNTSSIYHQIPELFPFFTKYHTAVLKVSYANQQNKFSVIKILKIV